jgi:hypothetical protein
LSARKTPDVRSEDTPAPGAEGAGFTGGGEDDDGVDEHLLSDAGRPFERKSSRCRIARRVNKLNYNNNQGMQAFASTKAKLSATIN